MQQLEAAVKIAEIKYPKQTDGNGCGYLTNLVAIKQWQRMHLMS